MLCRELKQVAVTGGHHGGREREVSEVVPFKLSHEQRLDYFICTHSWVQPGDKHKSLLKEFHLQFMITDFYRTLDTAGNEITFFSSPSLTQYFSNLQYLPFPRSVEAPASCFTEKTEAVTNCLEHKRFSGCPPPRLPTHATFLLLLWISLLGQDTRLFLPLLPQLLCLVAFPTVASAPLPRLSYILLFLSLPDQAHHQSSLSENGTRFSSLTVAAQVLAVTLRTLAGPQPSCSHLALATLAC